MCYKLKCVYVLGFVGFELNSIRFIDLDPGPKQTIREPDPVHEK